MVAAGLQRDVRRGAGRGLAALACLRQRHHFGVRTTGALGMAFSDDLAIHANQHAADARVGVAQKKALRRKAQSPFDTDLVHRFQRQHSALVMPEPVMLLTPRELIRKPPHLSLAMRLPVIGDMVSV